MQGETNLVRILARGLAAGRSRSEKAIEANFQTRTFFTLFFFFLKKQSDYAEPITCAPNSSNPRKHSLTSQLLPTGEHPDSNSVICGRSLEVRTDCPSPTNKNIGGSTNFTVCVSQMRSSSPTFDKQKFPLFDRDIVAFLTSVEAYSFF